MTNEETMQEIAKWMESDMSHKLGGMERQKGEWILRCFWDTPSQQSMQVCNTDAARHYITGWLLDWFVESEQAILNCLGTQGWLEVTAKIPSKDCLPALWAAYKRVKKIEVADANE